MRNDIEITSNMDLGQYSPLELTEEEINEAVAEKAVSKAQQRFFGMVDAYKKGEMKDASPAIKKAAKGMTKKEVKDFAKTKHKGLPEHVNEDYSSQGGLTNKYDIEAFERFIPHHRELPLYDQKELKNTLMMYRDLSYKIYNCLPKEITDESFKYLRHVYTFLERGDKHNANEAYKESIRILLNGLEKHKVNPDYMMENTSEKLKRLVHECVNSLVNEMDERTKLKKIIKESVQAELVKVLGRYTRGEASSKEANKAIMDLANSSNYKINENSTNELSIDTERNFLNRTKRFGRDIQHNNGKQNIIDKYNQQYAFTANFEDGAYLDAYLNNNLSITLKLLKPNNALVFWIIEYSDSNFNNLKYVVAADRKEINQYDFSMSEMGYYIDNLKAAQRNKYKQLIEVMKRLNNPNQENY